MPSPCFLSSETKIVGGNNGPLKVEEEKLCTKSLSCGQHFPLSLIRPYLFWTLGATWVNDEFALRYHKDPWVWFVVPKVGPRQ